MHDHAVVICGGGPTGLTLAAELALAGVKPLIVERRPTQDLIGRRAGGLHARTIEAFDQRGIAARFISEGKVHPFASYSMCLLSLNDLPSRHNYVLGLWQKHIERILADWADELAVPVLRGHEVSGICDKGDKVLVRLSDGTTLRAAYLVGCDGGRSIVRKEAGIEFAGWPPTISNLLAEVQMRQEPKEWGIRRDDIGVHALSKLEDGKTIGVMLTEQTLDTAREPTLGDLGAALVTVYGTNFGVHSPTSISRFTDATRQAVNYRKGRILLAGDAAHVHAPDGGQGLNVGVQDAMNLGWKLAQVVKGISPESILESYHAERHPVAARVLSNTMAQVALRRQDERSQALRSSVADLLKMDEPRRHHAQMLSGLDIRYDIGDQHPLMGRRMPDVDLIVSGLQTRTFSLLHRAQGLSLNLGLRGASAAAPWADRVQIVDAECAGAWDIPGAGKVSAPRAVLIRPDGYIAWAGEDSEAGLVAALHTWFGPPLVS